MAVNEASKMDSGGQKLHVTKVAPVHPSSLRQQHTHSSTSEESSGFVSTTDGSLAGLRRSFVDCEKPVETCTLVYESEGTDTGGRCRVTEKRQNGVGDVADPRR